MPGGGRITPPPLRFFRRNSKKSWDIEKKLSDFDFTPLKVIIHILSITMLIRCCHSNLLFTVCHVIFGTEENKKTWIIFKIITWLSSNLVERVTCRPWIQIHKKFNVWRHFDVTMTKRQNTHYDVIFSQNTLNFAQLLLIRLYLPTQNLV